MLFDYDNDGDLDVAVDSSLFINKNDNFEFHQFATFEDTIISLPQGSATHADFNNDGYEDLVYGGGNNVMRLFINSCSKEDGSWFEMYEILDFQTLSDPGFSANNYGITSCDFNQDGLVDIAVSYRTNLETNKIAIFYNINGTTFTWQDVFVESHQQHEIGNIMEVEAGDFDNDGDVDLLYSYNTVEQCKGDILVNDQTVICILFNDGKQNFSEKKVIATRGMPIIFGGKNVLFWREIQRILSICRVHTKIESNDFDLDGDLDFVTGDLSGKVELFVNDGTGQFDSKNQESGVIGDFGYVSMGIDSGDYDHDGDPDLIVCGTEKNRFSEILIYLSKNYV
jgi:hypothetical protein